jgi:phosphocarrier protein HPr
MNTQRVERNFTLTHEYGMHARPAARLVKTACRFDSDISLQHQGVAVNAKSILGVLSLGIVCGEQVVVVATGADAAQAIQAIGALFETSFDSEEEPAAAAPAVFSSFVAIAIARSGILPESTAAIESLRTQIKGVNGLHVDQERNRVHILYDGRQVTLQAIVEALQKRGYEAHAPDYIWHSRAG